MNTFQRAKATSLLIRQCVLSSVFHCQWGLLTLLTDKNLHIEELMGLFWDPMLGMSHVNKKATFYSDTSKCLVLALPKCKNPTLPTFSFPV